MWNYEKRLEYPVNITTPNPKILQLSFIAVEIIYNCYSTLDQFISGLFYTIVLNKIVSCLVETHSGDCFIQIRFRFNSLASQVIFAYMIPG